MYYFTSKAALAALVAVFGLESGLPLPDDHGAGMGQGQSTPAQAVPQEAGFLEIESNGYSRFEVEGDEVVARFSGGVEFKYMGFAGHAEDLVYHHATQSVTATGDVGFELGEVSISTTQALLDVMDGTATLGEPVYARLRGRGIFLESQSAKMNFEQGAPPSRVADVRATLSGGVSAYSTLGSWLETETLSLDGESGELATAGAFAVTLSSEQLKRQQENAGLQWGALRISGTQAGFRFDEEGLLEHARFHNLVLNTDIGSINATKAEVSRAVVEGHYLWNIELAGQPLTGSFASPQQLFEMQCQRLNASFLAGGEISGFLEGDVQLDTKEQLFTGGALLFSVDENGEWHVEVPHEFSIGFQLSDDSEDLGQIPGAGEA